MRTSLSHRRATLAGMLAAALMPMAALAQSGYPNRPITLVIPFPPGGQTDVIGRLIGDKLAQQLGQPVVIENKTGVNGSLASDAVARAKPDGYTLVVGGPGTHAINQLVNPNVKYDTRTDFTHIALLGRVPMIMLASPSFKARTLAEVTAMAKAKPGAINMALTGIGSSSHMTTELYKQSAGISLNHVPYKGDMPAMTDLMGGQADLLFVPTTSALPFIQSGKLRALGVADTKRLDTLPDVPTLSEAGQPELVNYSWTSLAGPAGLPAEIVQKLNQACQTILAQPDVIARLATMSNQAVPSTPEQAGAFIANEVARWSKVVEAGNIRIQ